MVFRHRIEAFIDLVGRYRTIFQFHWQHRHQFDLPDFKADEAEFMPAALSLQLKPVSPAGRWIARLLMLLVLIALIWSVIGQIDIVVNGQGKIIPGGYTKTLASVEVARVVALQAEEGKTVKAGEILMILDSRAADSDRDKANVENQIAVLEVARSKALLTAIETGKRPVLDKIAVISEAQIASAQQHLHDQYQDFVAKKARLDSEIQHLNQSLPIVTRQANDYKELSVAHDVSEHAWLEKQQAKIDLERQLADRHHQLRSLITETRKAAQDTLKEASRIADSAEQDKKKAQVHGDQLVITAPIDGTVQQLSIHTIGGVVPAAEPLMQIVPQQASVEFEAFIENKDVGFIEEGQTAEIKIDAFEYTKYGTVPAKVTHVSRDAIEDEKKGLIYSVRVGLNQSSIQVRDKSVALSPGMSGSVEIKTGTRRVIEYVLSPLLQHGHESLHER
ncbi:MAG: HlyD family type I secretion periplasmic adaptor subunit [Methylomonas sp.]